MINMISSIRMIDLIAAKRHAASLLFFIMRIMRIMSILPIMFSFLDRLVSNGYETIGMECILFVVGGFDVFHGFVVLMLEPWAACLFSEELFLIACDACDVFH